MITVIDVVLAFVFISLIVGGAITLMALLGWLSRIPNSQEERANNPNSTPLNAPHPPPVPNPPRSPIRIIHNLPTPPILTAEIEAMQRSRSRSLREFTTAVNGVSGLVRDNMQRLSQSWLGQQNSPYTDEIIDGEYYQDREDR